MIMRILMYLLVFVTVAALSCRKDNPLACATYALEISDEATAWGNAATAWSNDPTAENCRAYKDAGQKYLNALKRYDGCTFTAADRASFNANIKEAEDELNALNC